MQEKIEKHRIFSRKCSLTKMKMSGIKEKVTMVKKEADFNLHLTLGGTLKVVTPNQWTKAKLIHIEEDKMNLHRVY